MTLLLAWIIIGPCIMGAGFAVALLLESSTQPSPGLSNPAFWALILIGGPGAWTLILLLRWDDLHRIRTRARAIQARQQDDDLMGAPSQPEQKQQGKEIQT